MGYCRDYIVYTFSLQSKLKQKQKSIFQGCLNTKIKLAKSLCKDSPIAAISDDDILSTVKQAQARARLKMKELGIDNLFKKHSIWGHDVKIPGIDGGAEYRDDESDEDDDNDYCSDQEQD